MFNHTDNGSTSFANASDLPPTNIIDRLKKIQEYTVHYKGEEIVINDHELATLTLPVSIVMVVSFTIPGGLVLYSGFLCWVIW